MSFVQLQKKTETCAEDHLQEHGPLTSEPEASHPVGTEGPLNTETGLNQDEAAPDDGANSAHASVHAGEG